MHIAIIGNGVSGISTARHIRKLSKHSITVISSESKYFFARTALMYVYMGHMRFKETYPYEKGFWKKNKIDLLFDTVVKIDADNQQLVLKSGNTTHYDKLVLALGSVSRPLNIPGANLLGVQGLYSKQDLEQLETISKNIENATVIGGGLIGVELAEMLHSRGISVTLIVREEKYFGNILPKEEADIVGGHIQSNGIKVLFDTNVKHINGTSSVESVTLGSGKRIACQFVGVTIGVMPNTKLVNNTEINCNKGILVDMYLQTNKPNIYAIGDCAEMEQPVSGRKAVEAVWYTARMMGETLARTICKKQTPYKPGIWFNSAKFVNLEYQTYGEVPIQLKENLESVFWKKNSPIRFLRIVYNKSTRSVKGFNALGIRLRHEICDKWIEQEYSIDYVLNHIEELNFNSEFSEKLTHLIAN